MAVATALEKKYQRVRAEATAFACDKFGVEPNKVLIAWSEHDCVVDVYMPGEKKTTRFIYFYEED